MYNVYFTVVEMMFVNFCTHLCKVQLPVCIFVNLSLTIMCFFDAFVCTLHFACIQIVKRLLVSPSIVHTVEHFSSLDHFLFLSLRVVFDDERCCLYYFNNKTDSASQG